MDTSVVPRAGNAPVAWDKMRELVRAFLSGRNQRTLEAYRQDLEGFRSFVGAQSLDTAAGQLLSLPPGEANALALAYKTDLHDRGLKAATVNRRLAALRSFVKLARTLGIVTWSLEVENLRAEAYRDTRGPGRDGYRRLLGTLSNRRDPKGIRDRAILRLLYDLGLRRGEVVGLDLRDVDIDNKTLEVLGKGRSGKEILTLPEPTQKAIEAWLAVRGNTEGPLFTNFDRARKGNGRLSGAAVYHLVRKYGEQIGLKVRPHGLRHAAITDALDLTGGNVRAVQRFSRHRDLRILNVYDDNREDLGGEVARLVAGAAVDEDPTSGEC